MPTEARDRWRKYMRTNMDTWTRDADGEPVDWTKPPYRKEGSGIVNLLLEGEAAVRPAELSKRLDEYTALTQRRIWGKNKKALRTGRSSGPGNRQGQLV